MSEINGQTDDVALLVNWFFCSPFPPYENLKVDKALGVEAVSYRSRGWERHRGGHSGQLQPAAGSSSIFFFFLNGRLQCKISDLYLADLNVKYSTKV